MRIRTIIITVVQTSTLLSLESIVLVGLQILPHTTTQGNATPLSISDLLYSTTAICQVQGKKKMTKCPLGVGGAFSNSVRRFFNFPWQKMFSPSGCFRHLVPSSCFSPYYAPLWILEGGGVLDCNSSASTSLQSEVLSPRAACPAGSDGWS